MTTAHILHLPTSHYIIEWEGKHGRVESSGVVYPSGPAAELMALECGADRIEHDPDKRGLKLV